LSLDCSACLGYFWIYPPLTSLKSHDFSKRSYRHYFKVTFPSVPTDNASVAFQSITTDKQICYDFSKCSRMHTINFQVFQWTILLKHDKAFPQTDNNAVMAFKALPIDKQTMLLQLINAFRQKILLLFYKSVPTDKQCSYNFQSVPTERLICTVSFSDERCFLDAGSVHQLLRDADLHENHLHRCHLVPLGQHPLRSETSGANTIKLFSTLSPKPRHNKLERLSLKNLY
jgi:hypothetical protein